jgi:hypothetical protein
METAHVNIWALPKDPSIRLALLRLSGDFDLQSLALDCSHERNRQAIQICDRALPGLSAYLFTYGQSPRRYGVQLQYPSAIGSAPPFGTLEELRLDRVIQLLGMHFDLI